MPNTQLMPLHWGLIRNVELSSVEPVGKILPPILGGAVNKGVGSSAALKKVSGSAFLNPIKGRSRVKLVKGRGRIC